jgi:hypothetical protein
MLSLSELIAYIESLRPGFGERIRGASPAAIAELERLAERRLPDIQRELLARTNGLGEICAGFVGADMRVEALLEHFRENGWRPPEPFVLLGVDEGGLPISSFLRCAPELTAPELVQFTIPGGERALVPSGPDNYDRMAPSLPAWLYRCAFINLVGATFQWKSSAQVIEAQRDHGARFDAIMLGRGLRREPGTDAMTGAYRAREAAVLWSRNGIDDPIFVSAYANDPGATFDPMFRDLGAVAYLDRYMVSPVQDPE